MAPLVFNAVFRKISSMSARELILLSPYRLPTQNTLYLSDDDVAAFLNAHAALWHPAAACGAVAPPRIGSPYDFEQPTPGHVYAIPETPPLMLPDDWEFRVREAGAVSFRATPDRAVTLANLLDALRSLGDAGPPRNLVDLPVDQAAPFFGIGLGYSMVEALFEAMSHENMLVPADLWQHVQEAINAIGGEDADAPRRHLQDAANQLQSAREVVYPVTLYLVDLCLLDDKNLEVPFPSALDKGLPLNVIVPAAVLERLSRERPDRLASLRERFSTDLAEVCGGPYLEREDVLLPLETQLWNLLRGQETYRELLGQEVRVFARKRFGFHPHLPLYLQSAGISRALLVAFDEAVLPSHRGTVVNWPSPDGKQVEAFARAPLPADSPQTFFHLAHHLHKTIMQDQSATLALVHRGKPAGPWYDDWLELSRFAPVLGRWTTLSGYFNEVPAGDYASAGTPDEFHGDYLQDRSTFDPNRLDYETPQTDENAPPAVTVASASPLASKGDPISFFARHVRARRRLDAACTFAALYQGLGGALPTHGDLSLSHYLKQVEDRLESAAEPSQEEASAAHELTANALAQRLVSRGEPNPGFLVLNPCSYSRRLALELENLPAGAAVAGPVKACQVDGSLARVVVEVPALGFAWFPKAGAATPPTSRMRLADNHCVRNEFLEAEVDPGTGGLRSIRDIRTRVPRLGQQLVFNPGSTARVKQIRTTSTGPALGEIISEGVLVDAQDEVIASFRQRFRTWFGRPVLDLRIEITPVRPPHGYPWHAYYAARFAWRDERALLARGAQGVTYSTAHTRPETPDYLEIRNGSQNTLIFPGGLPFHQRFGGRMLDVILIAEGEQTTTFDLALGLDRDYPMLTAQGLVTPATVLPTTQGPPHVGATGWLFHLDQPNLLLTGLRPDPEGKDAVIARLLECTGHHCFAELRCPRNPTRATLIDARGSQIMDATVNGDAVQFDGSRYDLMQVRVEFGSDAQQ